MPRPKPVPRGDLIVMELDGEAVVYDERAGQLHHLNSSATIIWSLCDGSLSQRDVAATVADALGVAASDIQLQVEQAIAEFRAAGLLEGENSNG